MADVKKTLLTPEDIYILEGILAVRLSNAKEHLQKLDNYESDKEGYAEKRSFAAGSVDRKRLLLDKVSALKPDPQPDHNYIRAGYTAAGFSPDELEMLVRAVSYSAAANRKAFEQSVAKADRGGPKNSGKLRNEALLLKSEWDKKRALLRKLRKRLPFQVARGGFH